MTSFTERWLAGVSLGLLAALSVACGGGSSAPQPDPGNNGGNNNLADLSGRFTQDGSARVSSALTGTLSGGNVSVLSVDSGLVEGSQTLAADGSFHFEDLPAGDHLLRVNFEGNADFDADGSPDEVELQMPVNLIAGSTATVFSSLSAVDVDDDGESDGIDLDFNFQDDHGRVIEQLKRLLTRLQKLLEDLDGDGSFMDEEPKDDEDSDGLPDNLEGNQNGLHGGVLRGEISAISDTSLTVDGIDFSVTEDTRWRIKGNKNADSAEFDAGDSVLVRGFWNGDEWLATEIKKLTPRGHDDDDDDDDDDGDDGDGDGDGSLLRFDGAIVGLSDTELIVDENTFVVNSETQWFIDGDAVADSSGFSVGDFVFVKAEQQADALLALKVGLISHMDDGGGDDDEPLIETVNGEIELVDATSISVNGRVMGINAETQLYVEGALSTAFELLSMGDLVEVEAQQDGEAWIALKIRLLEDRDAPPDTLTVTGPIEALGLDSITVNGQVFSVNSETEIILEGGLGGSLEMLLLGQNVEVQSVAEGEGWLAIRIEVLAAGGLI